VIIKQNAQVVGWASREGRCEGAWYDLWEKDKTNRIGNLVVGRQYKTELRKFQAAFDSFTQNMMTHPFCLAEDGSCDTGESIIIYKLDKKECPLTLLKTIQFKVFQGSIFDERANENMRDKKRKKTLSKRKNTPTLYMSAKKEEMMKFIRKGIAIKC